MHIPKVHNQEQRGQPWEKCLGQCLRISQILTTTGEKKTTSTFSIICKTERGLL